MHPARKKQLSKIRTDRVAKNSYKGNWRPSVERVCVCMSLGHTLVARQYAQKLHRLMDL